MGGVNWSQFAIDLVDAVLWGIPSATIAQQINQKYSVEYGRLINLIEQLQQKANSADLQYANHYAKANALRDALYGANPIGSAYQAIAKEAREAESRANNSLAESTALRNKASQLSADATEAARKSSRSFGQIVAEDYNLP